ncbi:protein-disulfide reductase DsbD domain-containing protein [Puia dinghuensis]|nr:protein-disulfide reductase DsbD domain-containing protein [Puia dinghuensis]
MKKIILFSMAVLTGTLAMAQSSKEVNWTYSSKKIADKTYEIHMTATIGGDYHLYAQDAGGEGPIPTAFTFTKSPLLDLEGAPKEKGQLIKKFESAWNHDVKYYERTVDFVQVVKLKSNVKTNLSGKVEFMVCDDHECLPPATVDIKVNIGG